MPFTCTYTRVVRPLVRRSIPLCACTIYTLESFILHRRVLHVFVYFISLHVRVLYYLFMWLLLMITACGTTGGKLQYTDMYECTHCSYRHPPFPIFMCVWHWCFIGLNRRWAGHCTDLWLYTCVSNVWAICIRDVLCVHYASHAWRVLCSTCTLSTCRDSGLWS